MSLWTKVACGCLLLTAATDILFYDVAPGCNLGIFLLLMGAVSWLVNGRKSWNLPGGICSAGIAVLAAALFIDSSFMAFGLGLLLLFMLHVSGKYGWTDNYFRWIGNIGYFLFTAWGVWALDRRSCKEQRKTHRIKISWLLKWGIPLFLTFIFLLLFRSANPIIDQWLTSMWNSISGIMEKISLPAPFRFFCWAVVFIWIWAFIRLRIADLSFFEKISETLKTLFRNGSAVAATIYKAIHRRSGKAEETDLSNAVSTFCAAITVRCLILFNLLFLLQNLLDVKYLWSGSALPSGMTYASYAHRGAYPLIATAIMAAVFVLICFSGNKTAPAWRPARLLVYIWLAQNVFLVGSAIFRLMMYVNIYRLTLLRVSALIWMGLVAAGLILILLKIITSRNNRWLIHANVLVLFAVLTGCCYVDFRGYIAEYNIRHSLEVAAANDKAGRMPLDIDYCLELGPKALPALARLDYKTPEFSPERQLSLERAKVKLQIQVQTQPRDWQSWSWRMSRLLRYCQ